jgi:hypothetical protein
MVTAGAKRYVFVNTRVVFARAIAIVVQAIRWRIDANAINSNVTIRLAAATCGRIKKFEGKLNDVKKFKRFSFWSLKYSPFALE